MAPGCAAAASASARMRSLYSAVKVRRLALATTSGFGRGRAGGWGATVCPAATLRAASLRSASLRSAAGQTVGEAEEIPLFFTLIPVLALLSNYDQENCLINVGTEGEAERDVTYANRQRVRSERGRRLLKLRSQLVERSFAHMYDTGGMRRTHLRGRDNILKRLLIHAAAF